MIKYTLKCSNTNYIIYILEPKAIKDDIILKIFSFFVLFF